MAGRQPRWAACIAVFAVLATTLMSATPAAAVSQLAEAVPDLCVVDTDRPVPSASPSSSAAPSQSASASASASEPDHPSESETSSVSPSLLPSVEQRGASASESDDATDEPQPSGTPEPSASDDLDVPTPSPTSSPSSSLSTSASPTSETREEETDEEEEEEGDGDGDGESVEDGDEDVEEVIDVLGCPAAVVSLFAHAGRNEVRVSWSVVDGDHVEAPEWFAVVVRQGDAPARVVRVDAPASDAIVTGLRNGMEASFEVFAVTEDGSSEPAGPVVATPVTGVEGEVAGLLVGFAPGVEVVAGQQLVPGEQLLVGVDLTVSTVVTEDSTLVRLDEAVSMQEAQEMAGLLAADPAIAWAEPDRFLFTASAPAQIGPLAQTVSLPDDPEYSTSQWNLWDSFGLGVGDSSTSMTSAWTDGMGAGAIVAVIDTGITAHPDLDNQLVSGYDFVSNPEQLASSRQPNAPPVPFDGDSQDVVRYGALGWDADPSDPGDWRAVAPVRDSSWHGTKVAGVIAAQARNGEGIAGVAPSAKIQPIRALSWRGGLLSDIAASITWASGGEVTGVPINQTPAGVINLSLAAETSCPTALQDAIDGARSKGAVVIAAAGNANDDAEKYAPGNCQGVITVAATDREGRRAAYSNYGERIDVAAPGGSAGVDGGISTTTNNGLTDPQESRWAGSEGTSLAAAHVSGAAAILKGNDATLNPDAVEEMITGSIRPFADSRCDVDTIKSCGSGIAFLAQISAVGASRLILERSAVGTAAGSAFTIQPRVNIVDEENSVVTTDSSTIITASISAGGTLVGTVTATAAAGVVTFANLGISGTAGTAYTVTFASGSLISATQVITATTGPPTQLTAVSAAVQTLTVATVVADSPALRVTDSAGNAVAGVSVTFLWTVKPGTLSGHQPGSLNGANAVSDAGGIAEVTSWSLPSRAGANQLEATATEVAGQSVRFTVFAVAGPLHSFPIVYLSAPSPMYAGNTIGMRVSAVDWYGNRLVDYQGPITLTSGHWLGERVVNITSNGYVDVNQVFTYTTNTVGTWSTWIDVTDGTISTRTNIPITIRPLAPSRLLLVLPGETFAPGTESGKVGIASATAGNFTARVFLVDRFGNQSHEDDGYRNESTLDVSLVGTGSAGPGASLRYTARANGVWTVPLRWTTATPSLKVTAYQSPTTRGTCCPSLNSDVGFLEVVAGAPVGVSGQANWKPSVSVGGLFSPAPRAFISDQYGNLVENSSADITISSQNSSVSLTGTLTQSTSGGIVTFSDVRFFGPTTIQRLRFTASGLTYGVSESFTPSAGIASSSRSTLTLSRSSLIAGGDVASTVTVVAYDDSGNRVLSGGDSVDIQSTIGIIGPVTDNGNGTYTSNLSPGTVVGVGQVTALIGGSLTQSKSMTITGPATRLSLTTASVGSAAGSAFSTQPKITLLDDSYTKIEGDDSTVVLASVSAGAALVGTTTATASRGIATFTNLGISGVDGMSYLITYSSGGLTVATQTVTVTTGPAATISLSAGNGQTTTPGTLVAISPSVLIRDEGGNVVAGQAVTFAVALGDGTIIGASAISDVRGIAVLTSWQLGAVPGANSVTATAAGLSGSPVTFTATALQAAQSIMFAGPGDVEFDSPSFTVNGTATSDLRVTFRRGAGTSHSACSVSSSGLVIVLAVGICEITASQAGDARYAPALDVTRTFDVLPLLPSAPTITSGSMSAQAITIGFTIPMFTGGVPITGYQLTATPVGPGSVVTTSACTESPCTVSGLVNGTEYFVKVAAINDAGIGPSSGASSIIMPATAALPVGSLAAVPGDGDVELSWSALTTLQSGGGVFNRYEVYKRVSGAFVWTLVTDSLTARSTADFTVTGLVNGTSYEFQIVAITVANAVELSGHPAIVAEYPSTVPSAVQSLGVVAVEPTELIVSWSAPVSDGGAALSVPSYSVTVSASTPDASFVMCTPVGAQPSCLAQGLTHGATYSFTVVANNRMGAGVPSSITYAVPSVPATPPAAGGGASVGIPISPPMALMNGAAIGAVLQGGVLRRDVLLSRNATSSGWDAVSSGFALSVETMSPSGSSVALDVDGTMRVEPRGSVVASGLGYSPGTELAVFAIPVSRAFSARSATGAVYLGSVVASASGAVKMNVPISPDFVLGDYVLQLNGIVSGDEVLSVNLRLAVTELANLTSISMQRSGFFQPRSAQMSPNGTRKLAAMVSLILENEGDNAGTAKITVSAVSVSLDTPEANLALARARAAALVQELNQNGVAGQFAVSVLTPTALATRHMTSSRKPLTTLAVSFRPPG